MAVFERSFDGTRGNQFPFILQRIPPVGGPGPMLKLRAYFKGPITHESSPSWDARQDIGRADPKYMYQTFSRNISFSFDLVAEGGSFDANYIKDTLNELDTMTVPLYKEGKGFQGNYVKFTIGKLYVGQYGIITAFNVTFDNSQITWDLDAKLPYFANVSMTIAWIGKRRPDIGTKTFG